MSRRRVLISLSVGLLAGICLRVQAEDRLPEPFVLYQDHDVEAPVLYVPSGWMGDWGDLNLDMASKEQPYGGTTCLRITYSAKGAQGQRWAGMFWQHPANNWGDKDEGLDLTGARRLLFMARGAVGGEVIDKFQVGGIRGWFPDTCQVHLGPITLTSTWQRYVIPLEGKNLSSVIGAFAWAANSQANPRGFTFYLDEIHFE